MTGQRTNFHIPPPHASFRRDRLARMRSPSRKSLLVLAAATGLALCGFKLSYMWGFSDAVAFSAHHPEEFKGDRVVETGAGDGIDSDRNVDRQEEPILSQESRVPRGAYYYCRYVCGGQPVSYSVQQ